MTDTRIKQLEWLPELMQKVRQDLSRRQEGEHRARPALEAEREALNRKIKGWTESLAKTDLPTVLRTTIERESAATLTRVEELDLLLEECQAQESRAEQVIDESEVLNCLTRLEDVLASECPTLANLALSMHIDRIVSHRDGHVVMRTCKIGLFPGTLDLLLDEETQQAPSTDVNSSTAYRPKPRRRGRIRGDLGEDLDFDVVAAANFAVDPDRFAGLPDKWFWIDEFAIPDKEPSWAKANAEAIFRRRQEAKLSYAMLGTEFGVTAPTARAAVKHYLETHPDARDEVDLPRGGQRPQTFDPAEIGPEARALSEAGWAKLKLAEKYGCSTPTIDKVLAWAYEQDSETMPTRGERKQSRVKRARAMYDAGQAPEEIAEALVISVGTARLYLQESLAAEGRALPDRRCKPNRSE